MGFGGRYVLRQMPNVAKTMQEAMKAIPKIDADTVVGSKYYKGGFDPKMSRREAALILGRYTINIQGSDKLCLPQIFTCNINCLGSVMDDRFVFHQEYQDDAISKIIVHLTIAISYYRNRRNFNSRVFL